MIANNKLYINESATEYANVQFCIIIIPAKIHFDVKK